MKSKCLLLSSLDIRDDVWLNYISSKYDAVYRPIVNQTSVYKIDSVETEIAALNAAILSDCQKGWYQHLKLSSDFNENGDYQKRISHIAKQLEQETFLIHDPFLAHSLPLWLSHFEKSALAFCYSQPMECALRLQEHWRFPLSVGLALWENQVLAACRSLQHREHVLISLGKLQKGDLNYLESILNSLNIPTPDAWPAFSQTYPTLNSNSRTIDTAWCNDIFELLENGDLHSLANRQLSAQSEDLLNYYGQLRSGFESIKDERDQLRQQLKLDHQKAIKVDLPSASEPHPLDDEQTRTKTTVHINGMDPLELYCEPGSSVLEMLQNCLVSGRKNELLYLNYSDSQEGVVYFMSSDLLALETVPSS